MTELIFGTHNKWQAALVMEGRDVIAAFYDSLDNPNLNGAVATGRVMHVHGERAFVELPDGAEGMLEGKRLPAAGSNVVVRITNYKATHKAWPARLSDDTPSIKVQWHDAAQSVIEHAVALYAVPQTAMHQDDDAVADFIHQHTGTEHLRDNASIVVEQTSALTTIDLNTGHMHGIANYIAAFGPAIAQALRHYSIGGAIVVDAEFLGAQARKGLGDKLEKELAADPLHPKLVSVTRMGLIEITRPRIGPSLLQVTR